MPLSRPRRRKKYKIKPQWEALLKSRIDAVAATGGLFGYPSRGSRSKRYDDNLTDAIRAGDVTVQVLRSSPEVVAKGKTWRRWERAEAQRAQ